MSKHSSPPWEIVHDEKHPANLRITSRARRHIAKVYAESLDHDPVCLANARIMIAAPEMRDPLVKILELLMTCDEQFVRYDYTKYDHQYRHRAFSAARRDIRTMIHRVDGDNA